MITYKNRYGDVYTFSKTEEYVNQWTEDGESLICDKCKQVYSPDQSLEEEYKQQNEK